MTYGGCLVDRVSVILGVGEDLGRSTALALAREGADLVLVARRPGVIAHVGQEVRKLGRRAWELQADLTDYEQCGALASLVREEVDHVDIVVSILGGAGPSKGMTFDLARQDSFQAWRAVFETNFWAPAQAIGALLDLLRVADDPHVVMVNSISSVMPVVRRGAYASSKAALASLTRTLALELAPDGVRVNGLHMGATRTAGYEVSVDEIAAREGRLREDVEKDFTAMIPLGYLPSVEEIADTIVFLASPKARAITGQAIHANLGAWMI